MTEEFYATGQPGSSPEVWRLDDERLMAVFVDEQGGVVASWTDEQGALLATHEAQPNLSGVVVGESRSGVLVAGLSSGGEIEVHWYSEDLELERSVSLPSFGSGFESPRFDRANQGAHLAWVTRSGEGSCAVVAALNEDPPRTGGVRAERLDGLAASTVGTAFVSYDGRLLEIKP